MTQIGTTSAMENIITILDMDGFRINKKFYCTEAGILEVGQDVANSFFFDIGHVFGIQTIGDNNITEVNIFSMKLTKCTKQ